LAGLPCPAAAHLVTPSGVTKTGRRGMGISMATAIANVEALRMHADANAADFAPIIKELQGGREK